MASKEMVVLLVSTQIGGLGGSAEGMPLLLSPLPLFMGETESAGASPAPWQWWGWDVADLQILSLFSTV